MNGIAGLEIHQGTCAVHEAVAVDGARVAALRVVCGVLDFLPFHRVLPSEFKVCLQVWENGVLHIHRAELVQRLTGLVNGGSPVCGVVKPPLCHIPVNLAGKEAAQLGYAGQLLPVQGVLMPLVKKQQCRHQFSAQLSKSGPSASPPSQYSLNCWSTGFI